MTMKRQNKLGSYLAVTAGVGCAASVAEGAVVVTYFTPGTVKSYTVAGDVLSHTWSISPLTGNNRARVYGNGYDAKSAQYNSGYFIQANDDDEDTGFVREVPGGYLLYWDGIGGRNGAVVDGSTLNYMSLDFTGDDAVRESVAAFIFDGVGGGYIHSIARNDDNTPMSITDGITAITSPVPEPSSLALLALGSVGLAARRRRKAA